MTDPRYRTQLYTDASGNLVERHFVLEVTAGPDQGKKFSITEGGTVMVGTHPDNDLVLTDGRVSRYHLELQVRRDGLQLKDLDTTNGTQHRGVKLGSVIVTEAARIKLGKYTEIDIRPIDQQVDVQTFSADRLGKMLGRSSIMRQLFALITRIAPTEATILLQGETGTGKEAVAEAIHSLSPRAHKPFIVVDCGAIPRELIGSELFGHVRGAYTGASGDKEGLIAAAHGGTLFLDEIGELALDLQPQLLRVLDKRQVRRVGDTGSTKVDIRVVAASHRDLKDMVREGSFREDLFYRLAVVKTTVPPLRARPDDIPLLADHFAEHLGRGDFVLPPALLTQMSNHDWPGNVRELRNVIERALSLGATGALSSAGSPNASTEDAAAVPAPEQILDLPFKQAKANLVEGFEREYLTQLLDKHRGNISRAAADAGIDRNYIHRLIKRYGIKVDRD